MHSTKKLKLFGFIEFTLPAKIQVTASQIEGVFELEVAVILKDRYKFGARINSDGTWSISGEAFNVGPLQFLQDLLNINPWAWHDKLEQDDPNNFVVQAIGGMKKLSYEMLSCDRLSLIYRVSGDGEQMFIAAATVG